MDNVTEFPVLRRAQQIKPANKISDDDKKYLIEQFASMIDSPEFDDGDMTDISLSEEMFLFYLEQFPCFYKHPARKKFDALLRAYDEGQLTEAELLVVEFLLEILSDREFDFSMKLAFEVWSQDDISAFIKVLGFHSMSLQIEDGPDEDE